MEKFKKQNWQMKSGSLLILVGTLSIFPENGTVLHTSLQVIFITGCILFVYGGSLAKKRLNSVVVASLLGLFVLPNEGYSQDYSQQVEAFEQSFHQKDISSIQPYLSDSLKFNPLPIQNTIPVLTNVVSNLPKLHSIQILQSDHGFAYVEYNFEQLGVSESQIYFDASGKIWQIEFIDNLVRQQIEQQRRMQSSVQAPKPDKLASTHSKKRVEFPSKDGLIITSHLYEIDPGQPVILLLHQAGYNKYEYADIAPRLNKMGFNALAIDQRSGGSFANHENETRNRAIDEGQENIQFIDAHQDINAAIDFLAEAYQTKVIVWGSSYSSSLALHSAASNSNVKAVISFSPGDYFGDQLPSLKTVLPNISQPYFLTSSKEEAVQLKELMTELDQSDLQLQFIPESDGFHGSRAVWIDQAGADEYWAAITAFLNKLRS
jgi:dienelactone hydrolase